jgi:hypothetical protein
VDDCLTESNCVAFCVAFVVQDSIVAQGCWLPVMHIVCRFRIELKKPTVASKVLREKQNNGVNIVLCLVIV